MKHQVSCLPVWWFSGIRRRCCGEAVCKQTTKTTGGNRNERPGIFSEDFYNTKQEWDTTILNVPCHTILSWSITRQLLYCSYWLRALFHGPPSALELCFPDISCALFPCSARGCSGCSVECCQWPPKAPREVGKLLPGDAAVLLNPGLHPPAALPSVLACSLFFCSFWQFCCVAFKLVCTAQVFRGSGVVPKVSCSCSGTSKAKWFLNALLVSNLLLLLFWSALPNGLKCDGCAAPSVLCCWQ